MESAVRNEAPSARRWGVAVLLALGLMIAHADRTSIGSVSASLFGWLLHIGHSYTLPMVAIFAFLLLGAMSIVLLLQRKWAPRIDESVQQPRSTQRV